MAQGPADVDPTAADAEPRARWRWFVALGVALLILGFIAFGNLALQLRPASEVGFLCGGLVGSAPCGPGDDDGGLDLALGKPRR